MKITVGLREDKKIFGDTTISHVREIEYDNVNGMTYEFHEERETCTGQGEQCLVVHLNQLERDGEYSRATFPISRVAYLK